jgi:hypothetical protein
MGQKKSKKMMKAVDSCLDFCKYGANDAPGRGHAPDGTMLKKAQKKS